MYVLTKYKERYFWHYLMRARFINGTITCIYLLISIPSIATWIFWNYVPWMWAALVVIVQIIQAAYPHFPFAKQECALRYLLPSLRKLLLDIESEWRKIDIEKYDDKQIHKLITKFQEQCNDLETKYTDIAYMPVSKCCDKKAEQDCKMYFKNHYDV